MEAELSVRACRTPGGRDDAPTMGAGSSRANAAVVVDWAHSWAGVPVSVWIIGGRPDML